MNRQAFDNVLMAFALTIIVVAIVLAVDSMRSHTGGTEELPWTPATCPECSPTIYTPRAAP